MRAAVHVLYREEPGKDIVVVVDALRNYMLSADPNLLTPLIPQLIGVVVDAGEGSPSRRTAADILVGLVPAAAAEIRAQAEERLLPIVIRYTFTPLGFLSSAPSGEHTHKREGL